MNAMKWLGLASAVLCLAACAGGKYADVKTAINAQTAASEKFAAQIEQAANGKEAAAAIDRFSEQMAKMLKQAKTLKEKYEGVDLDAAPELKAENEQAQLAAMKFAGAFMKVTVKYGGDPDVQAALAKWQETMSQKGKP